MYSTPTMHAGRSGYLMNTADPLSPLTVLVTPAGVTDMPVPRPRLMVPNEIPVFPASACMIAGGSVETAAVQSPPPRGNRYSSQVAYEAAGLHHDRHEASDDIIRDGEANYVPGG